MIKSGELVKEFLEENEFECEIEYYELHPNTCTLRISSYKGLELRYYNIAIVKDDKIFAYHSIEPLLLDLTDPGSLNELIRIYSKD